MSQGGNIFAELDLELDALEASEVSHARPGTSDAAATTTTTTTTTTTVNANVTDATVRNFDLRVPTSWFADDRRAGAD
jgi:hypothetical protein